MTHLFMSQSANIDRYHKRHPRKPYTKREAISTLAKPIIYTLGDVDVEFERIGFYLGFNMKRFQENHFEMFGLTHLVLCELTTRTFFERIEVFTYCLSLGAPITWMHRHVLPCNWIHQFNNIFVGDFTPWNVWRAICE